MRALKHSLQRLEQRWRLYRWWVMPWRYWQYRRWVRAQQQALPEADKVVLFDFQTTRVDGPQGRRFYALFMAFVRAGYYPVFVRRYLFLVSIKDKIKRFCLREKFSVVGSAAELQCPYVHVSDRELPVPSAACQRQVLVDCRYDYPRDRQGFPFPFPMFPGIYATGADRDLARLREQPRRWQVFFGGSFRAERYSMSAISQVYGKLPRATALAALQRSAPEHWVEPTTQQEWSASAAQQQSGVLILNTKHVQVDSADWLGMMASARFFLALPGVSYPMSHNLVEALAVGTVPITEYPELFFPPLVDGVNCLRYRGEQGFVECVQRAQEMDADEQGRLAAGALDYYDNYLAPKAAIARLLSEPGNPVRLRQTPFILSGGRDL